MRAERTTLDLTCVQELIVARYNALEGELAKTAAEAVEAQIEVKSLQKQLADLKLQFIDVVELLPTEELKNNSEARNTKLAALKLRARYKEELAEVGGDPWELLIRKQAEVQTWQGAAADANWLLKAAPALTDSARDMPQETAAATQAVPAPVQRRQKPAPRNRTPHAAAAPRRQRRAAARAASSDDEAAPSARAAAAPGVQRKSGRTRVADLRVANAMLMLQVDSDSEGQGDCDTSADYLG